MAKSPNVSLDECIDYVRMQLGDPHADKLLALKGYVECLFQWNNVCAGLKLPGDKRAVGFSLWETDGGTSYTASIRCRVKKRDDVEYHIYSTSKSPVRALWLVARAAQDPKTAWREKPVWKRQSDEDTTQTLPDIADLMG